MVLKQTIAPTSRQTKYSDAVLEALAVYRHATNGQILDFVKQLYPEVSVTTVHRITARARSVALCMRKTMAAEAVRY